MPVIAEKKTRERDRRVVTYSPPSEFEIPEEVKNKFEAEGYHLRFIRVLLEDKDDFKNVARRRREGYEFVKISELPEYFQGLYESKNFGNAAQKYSGIVMVGDLALAKLPIENKEARDRYYRDVAIGNEAAVRSRLDADSKLNRILPILDESSTRVRVGSRKSAVGFGDSLKSTTTQKSGEDSGDEE